MKIYFLSTVILLFCEVSYAAEYYRCKDATGNITFSEIPCSPDAVVKSTRDSYLGGQKRNNDRSAIEQLQNYRKEVRRVESITGQNKKTIQKKNGHCETVSSLALRNARISKDVLKCHSMDDVRHIYGEPVSVSTWSDKSAYDTRWKYRTDDKRRIYIYFKQGKVTKWSEQKRR